MEELKPRESEALDILEAMLDVCDLENPGPMFAGQHVRGGICKITDEDATQLRQYIANRRVALETVPLTLEELRQMDGKPVWCEVLKEYGIVCLNIEWPAKECVWLPHGAHPISELIKGGIYASKPEGSERSLTTQRK